MTKQVNSSTSVETGNTTNIKSPAAAPQLHPYHPPTFVRHGSVANIVQNQEGAGNDGGGGFADDMAS